MTTPGRLLADIAGHLDAAAIPYMIVGSVAGSFHGEPRTTADIDIVIDPSAEALRRFVVSLPPSEYYVDENAAIEAYQRRTSFNVIQPASGWKVDLLLRKDRPFSRTEFGRRLTVRLFDRDTPIATAEDTILAKLEWAKAGESERQLRDVVGILAVNRRSLDWGYLEGWVSELELADVWERVRDETDGDDV